VREGGGGGLIELPPGERVACVYEFVGEWGGEPAHACHHYATKTHTWSGVRSGEGGGFVCEAEEKARAAVAAAGLALARPRRAAAVAVKRRKARGADMMWWCLQGRARTGNGRRWVGGGVACVQGVCRDGLSERRVCVFGRGCLEKDGDAEGSRSEEVAPVASQR